MGSCEDIDAARLAGEVRASALSAREGRGPGALGEVGWRRHGGAGGAGRRGRAWSVGAAESRCIALGGGDRAAPLEVFCAAREIDRSGGVTGAARALAVLRRRASIELCSAGRRARWSHMASARARRCACFTSYGSTLREYSRAERDRELAAPPLLRHPAAVEGEDADAAVVAARDDPLVVEAHRAHKVAVRRDAEEQRRLGRAAVALALRRCLAAALRASAVGRRCRRAGRRAPSRRRPRRRRRRRPARGGARGAARAPTRRPIGPSIPRRRGCRGGAQPSPAACARAARPTSSRGCARGPTRSVVPSADDATSNGSSGASVAASAPGGRETPVASADTHRECAASTWRQLCESSAPHAHRAVARRAAQVPLAAAAAAAAVGALQAAHRAVGVPRSRRTTEPSSASVGAAAAVEGGHAPLWAAAAAAATTMAPLASERRAAARRRGGQHRRGRQRRNGEVPWRRTHSSRRRRLEARARRLLVGPRGGAARRRRRVRRREDGVATDDAGDAAEPPRASTSPSGATAQARRHALATARRPARRPARRRRPTAAAAGGPRRGGPRAGSLRPRRWWRGRGRACRARRRGRGAGARRGGGARRPCARPTAQRAAPLARVARERAEAVGAAGAHLDRKAEESRRRSPSERVGGERRRALSWSAGGSSAVSTR